MSEWREKKLSDVVFLHKDSFKPDKESSLNYIGLEHIGQGSLRIESVGNSATVQSNKYYFIKGDVLFGKLRPYFRKVAKAPFDGVCSTDIWVCRAMKGNSQDYIFYFLANQEFVDIANSTDEGTRMPRVDWSFLKDTKWMLPPLTEQKAIAEVLSSLDDKIDLLSRQNKTLEALASTYFRQWFIEKASDDWEEVKLANCVKVVDNRGKTPPYIMNSTPYPVIEVKSISSGTRFIDYDACEKFVLENTYKTWFRAGHPQKNDILISTVGSIGEIAFFLEDKGSIAQNVVALRAINISHNYLYQYLRYYSATIKEMDIGSVQPSIKVPHLLSLSITIPPKEKLLAFDEMSITITNKMRNNIQQINTLKKLRDTLLPKLISGEARVAI